MKDIEYIAALRQQTFDIQNHNVTYPASADCPPINLMQWEKWLADFKAELIAAHGWTEREARLNILNGWACIRDGRLVVLSRDDHINTYCCHHLVVALSDDDARPAESVPVFLTAWPETGSWKMSEQIFRRLESLVAPDLAPRPRPYPTLLRLLTHSQHADGADESDEIKQNRAIASFWGLQLIEAWLDEELADVRNTDALQQVILCAFQTGRRHAILELRTKQPLSKLLEATWLKLHAKLGTPPTTEETAWAAGGVCSDSDGSWNFDRLDGTPSLTLCELDDWLEAIRYKHYALTDPVIRAGAH
jgi:hypothetical protein